MVDNEQIDRNQYMSKNHFSWIKTRFPLHDKKIHIILYSSIPICTIVLKGTNTQHSGHMGQKMSNSING